MSPEEFDNKLKSAFQDEHLQPKEQLWANISSSLEPKAKTTFWYWLLPVSIAVVVGMAWLGIQAPQSELVVANNTEESGDNERNPLPKEAINPSYATSEAAQISYPKISETANNLTPVAVDQNQNKAQIDGPSNRPQNKKQKKAENRLAFQSIQSTQNQARFQNKSMAFQATNSAPMSGFTAEMDQLNFFKFAWFPNFFKPYILEQLSSIALENKPNKSIKNQDNIKSRKTSDFSSKRWFTLGLGPQLALNSIRVNQDSQAWVHKHLWDNKGRLTSNGSGFQAFGHFALKFGKNQRFIFESGLNYSIRTEEIKLNESSFDIAARDNTGKINQYTQILLKVIYGTDTTYYLAASNFSLAVNNKYHILTVPFRLSAEHKISEYTYLAYGLGGGVSMINSHNTEHLNMIWGNSVKEKNSTQFSASLNANFSLYTNFNDIGQIGVYTGLQMYLNPWQVNSNQYAINMRDVQMGITFRKPF